MFQRLRRLDPGQPLFRILFFRFFFLVSFLLLKVLYRARFERLDRIPRAGGLLVVSNHQSHLDPPAVGVAIGLAGRHIVPIARQGLFNNRLFAWLIRNLNSIQLKEKESDAVALRRAVKELGAGRCILIFPEGSRSPDGALQPFKRGTWLMLSRALCPVLPVAIEGAFDAWPRDRSRPSLWGKRVRVRIGEPVDHDRLLAMGPDAALRFLAEEIETLRQGLRADLRQATRGRYPAPGPGDRGLTPESAA